MAFKIDQIAERAKSVCLESDFTQPWMLFKYFTSELTCACSLSCFLCAVTKFQRDPNWKKPVVPKNGDKPIHGLVSDKNFIVANAVENILAGK